MTDIDIERLREVWGVIEIVTQEELEEELSQVVATYLAQHNNDYEHQCYTVESLHRVINAITEVDE